MYVLFSSPFQQKGSWLRKVVFKHVILIDKLSYEFKSKAGPGPKHPPPHTTTTGGFFFGGGEKWGGWLLMKVRINFIVIRMQNLHYVIYPLLSILTTKAF